MSRILWHLGNGGGRNDLENLPGLRYFQLIPMPHILAIQVPWSSIDRDASIMIVRIVLYRSAVVRLLWVMDISRVVSVGHRCPDLY